MILMERPAAMAIYRPFRDLYDVAHHPLMPKAVALRRRITEKTSMGVRVELQAQIAEDSFFRP